MPIIANWLRPTDTLASIEGGARAGLSARQSDQADAAREIAANEAAQRLKLSYDSLAQARDQQLRSDSRMREANAAANALRKQRAESLDEYRKAQAGKIADAEAEKALEATHTSGAASLIANGSNPLTAIAKFPKANHSFATSVFENERAKAREEEQRRREDASLTKEQTRQQAIQERLDQREKTPKIQRTYEVDKVDDQPETQPKGWSLSPHFWPSSGSPAVQGSPAYKETITNPAPTLAPAPTASAPMVKAGQIVISPDGQKQRAKANIALPDGWKLAE